MMNGTSPNSQIGRPMLPGRRSQVNYIRFPASQRERPSLMQGPPAAGARAIDNSSDDEKNLRRLLKPGRCANDWTQFERAIHHPERHVQSDRQPDVGYPAALLRQTGDEARRVPIMTDRQAKNERISSSGATISAPATFSSTPKEENSTGEQHARDVKHLRGYARSNTIAPIMPNRIARVRCASGSPAAANATTMALSPAKDKSMMMTWKKRRNSLGDEQIRHVEAPHPW
jgi:hypothetical protein